jgi:hypothetical protein
MAVKINPLFIEGGQAKIKRTSGDTMKRPFTKQELKDAKTDADLISWDDLKRIMNKIGNIKTQYGKFIGEDVQAWANIRVALAWELMPSRRAKEPE